MKKRDVLKSPVVPLDVRGGKSVSELVDQMRYVGFQGRKLGEAIEIWRTMLAEEGNAIWLGIAGAMVPAGMRRVVSYLIKNRMVDVVVSTGANLYHDLFELRGGKHYLGSPSVDDLELRKRRISRIYDIFVDEDKFYRLDQWIDREFSEELVDDHPYSSREVLEILGGHLAEKYGGEDSILVSAFEEGVPVFSPALGDSSLGFSLMFANRRRGRSIIIDQLKDVDESSRIVEKSRVSSAIYVGGGTPKSFIQQAAVIASYQTRHDRRHMFAVQFTTDLPVWGGLSGCTLEEGKSWGKIGVTAETADCHVDATLALPLAAHTLADTVEMRRSRPIITWNGGDPSLTFNEE